MVSVLLFASVERVSVSPMPDFLFLNNINSMELFYKHVRKSCVRETKHLSTDANSSTDTTVGWTKNTQKPTVLEKRKKSSKTQKLKNV